MHSGVLGEIKVRSVRAAGGVGAGEFYCELSENLCSLKVAYYSLYSNTPFTSSRFSICNGAVKSLGHLVLVVSK